MWLQVLCVVSVLFIPPHVLSHTEALRPQITAQQEPVLALISWSCKPILVTKTAHLLTFPFCGESPPSLGLLQKLRGRKLSVKLVSG